MRLQSAFCESFGSERGFKARFASHLIQNGASNASHLIQNGDSKRVSRIIWFKTCFRCWIKWLTKRTLKPRFGFLTVTNLPGTPENSWTRFIYINYYESAPKIEQGTDWIGNINTWSGFSSRVSRHARRVCVCVCVSVSGSGFCEV